MRGPLPAALAVLLFAITFALFARVLAADFVMWDDDVQLRHNQSLGGVSVQRIAWAFTDFETASRYIPLTLLGWIINFELGGRNPFGYHLGNLLLHCGSVVMAFFAIAALLRAAENKGGGETLLRQHAHGSENIHSSPWIWLCAAIGAASWGWHPMRVEPVAWATTRTYCQSMFFLLLCAWLYLRAFAKGGDRQRYSLAFYWLSITAYVLSMLSYPLGLTLPAILLLVDVYPLRRARFSGEWWRNPSTQASIIQKAPYVAVAMVLLAVGLMARFHQSNVYSSRAAWLDEFGIIPRVMQAFYLCGYYAWRPWWPFHLAPVRTELIHFSPTDWPFVLSMVIVVSMTLALLIIRRRWQAALALWLFHLIALLPVLGWTEHPHYATDRYSLLQGLAWPIALASSAAWLGRRTDLGAWRIAAVLSIAAAILVLAGLTYRQTTAWRNSITFFSHILTTLDKHDLYRADPYWRLGVSYATADPPDWAMAEQAFIDGVKANPHDPNPRLLLAKLMSEQSRFDQAIAVLRDGVNLSPDSIDLRLQLAILFGRVRRYPEAIDEFAEILKRRPDHEQARTGLEAARQSMPVLPMTIPSR